MKNFSVSDLMEMGAQFQKDRKIQISNDTKTIRSLYQLYIEKKLVLQDWFQRGFHWDHTKKVMLIHTLLNTPKLLTEVVFFIDEDGTHYVADGQQRLTSIFSFLDGEFDYLSPDLASTSIFRGVKYGTKEFQKCAERLKDTPIKTTEIDNFGLDRDKVNILKSYVFMKWNNGSNLNAAELRGGLYSTVNDIVKPLVSEMDETTKQALILSKKFGRNKINELLEKLIYHMITKELVKDPTPKQLMQMHGDKSIDSEQPLIKKTLNAIIEGVVLFKSQNKTYQAGATSMRDIMVAAIKLKKSGKLSTIEDIKNYIFSTLKTINSVYATNKKFKAYYKADTKEMNEEVNKDWFQPYFGFFGRGQDGHTAKRVKFLMDKMNDFVVVTERDKTRIFPLDMQLRVLETQNNKCKICDADVIFSEVEADHILEYSLGGLTSEENLQLLCVDCHKEKTKEFMKQKNLVESFN
jgi:hypothetical protein